MRRIVLMLSISVDGFMAGPEGELDWQLVDEELHLHFNEVLAEMSAFLSGRVTHELMVGFWPTADADPESSPAMVAYSAIWRDKPKYVFSRTLTSSGWNTTVVNDVTVDSVTTLKEQPGNDMALGGADLAASFMRLDLIDEYRLYVHPVVLGRGKPLFGQVGRKSDLKLLQRRTFGSGVVLLRYDVIHQQPAEEPR